MKYALLIGINEYPAPNQLRGCVNDVLIRKNTLVKRFGFEEVNITMLIDAAATTYNIINCLRVIKAKLAPGDLMYMLYSGHGAQIPDPSPDKHEVDGLAEVMCPVDFDWTREHMLIDDDLNEFLADFPINCEFVAMFDSCHSGDGLRELTRPVGKNLVFKNKFIAPVKSYSPDAKVIRPLAPISPSRKGILISGCKANQTSADANIGGKPCGAFSYCVEKALATAKYNITYSRLANNTALSLRLRGFSQLPELDCNPEHANKKVLA